MCSMVKLAGWVFLAERYDFFVYLLVQWTTDLWVMYFSLTCV